MLTEDGEGEKSNFIPGAGRVRIVYANGDTFTGEVNEERRKCGQGVYEFAKINEDGEADGVAATYTGDFDDSGARTGQGTLVLHDQGEQYRGQFKDGFRHGQGSYTYANKDIYSGEWNSGQRHGQGIYVFADSRCVLTGVWEGGVPVEGKLRHPDGTVYEGNFREGRYDGMCSFKFGSGLAIDGEFFSLGVGPDAAERVRWKSTSAPRAC
mmetsp:Transcript_5235/g.14934  ORF Transcript_5235/g.14934 Transcript_5235/m.14934 type:complete len:210 (+) Transcript_5235:3-632(+)